MNLDQARTFLGQLRDALDVTLGQRAPDIVPIPVPSSVVVVPAGANLQTAIDSAQPGTVLNLADGATYTGTFVCPSKKGCVITGTAPIGPGRVTPETAANFPKIKAAPGGAPAFSAATGASDYTCVGLEFLPNPGGFGEIIQLGNNATTLTGLPERFVFDRCYIHGDPAIGQKRGIALNAGATAIRQCCIRDCKVKGQEAQAIAGWAGPGPYTIVDCLLEAAGENVIFGGSDPAIANLTPSDIIIRDCTLSKPLAWKAEGWTVKNILELKNARRVTIDGNLLERTWLQAQTGYAVLFNVRNQDGAAPWCTVEDVLFRKNTIRSCGGGFNILGRDSNHPSGRMARVTIEDNVIEDLDPATWGGDGRQFLIAGGPDALTIRGNRVSGAHINSALTIDGPAICSGLVVEGNRLQEGEYGIFSDVGLGKVGLDKYAAGYAWKDNIIVRGTSGRNIAYPTGTTVVDA